MDENVTLSLQDVTFTYEGEVIARRGEFVVVLGANSAGKSTLCYLLSGITPHIYGGHRRGIVSVAGIDPWDVPLYETSQVCGALMQDPEVQLFMPTIRTELAFGPANLGVPREEILRRSEVALSLVRMNGYEEGRSSASRLPVCLPCSRVCSCWTNRLRNLIRPGAGRSVKQLSG
jgi:energy-coupling factor transporter ATP-binding protein EcfA2